MAGRSLRAADDGGESIVQRHGDSLAGSRDRGHTAIYSFMDAILMRSLPDQPESLVVRWHAKGHPGVARNLNGSVFRDPQVGLNSGNFPMRHMKCCVQTARYSPPCSRSKMFLFGMKARDTLAISAAAAILSGAALAAGYGPAWRASKVDPMEALRK